MTTKTATVTITETTEIEGYGIFPAGDYCVEMPVEYDPKDITADDIVHDYALRVVTDTVIALISDVTPNRGTVERIIESLDDLPEIEDARDRYVRVPAGTEVGVRIWYTDADLVHDVTAEVV